MEFSVSSDLLGVLIIAIFEFKGELGFAQMRLFVRNPLKRKENLASKIGPIFLLEVVFEGADDGHEALFFVFEIVLAQVTDFQLQVLQKGVDQLHLGGKCFAGKRDQLLLWLRSLSGFSFLVILRLLKLLHFEKRIEVSLEMEERLLQGFVGILFLIELVHDLGEKIDGLEGELLQESSASLVSEEVVEDFLVLFSLERSEVDLDLPLLVYFDSSFFDEGGDLFQRALKLGFVLEIDKGKGRVLRGGHFLEDELGDFESEGLVAEVQLEVGSESKANLGRLVFLRDVF